MDIKIINPDGEKSDVSYANDFLFQLRQSIEKAKESLNPNIPRTPQLQVACATSVWNLLTSDDSVFFVQNNEDHGSIGYELLKLVFFDDFAAVMEDPSAINIESIRMTTPRECAMSFLKILAVQVLNFTPNNHEDVVLQLLRQVANTFNGQNRFHIAFELIGYKGENDEDHEFTGDLSSYLIV